MTSSGTQAQKIEISDYGTGDLPIISGGVPLTNWVQHTGNIYRTSVSGPVKYVFSNGVRQELARTPNTGWFRTTTASNTYLTSSDITQGNGYWTGGELVIRSTNWSYENVPITANVGNSLAYGNLYFNPGNYAWGFFMRNKLSALDSAGEWYYDPTSGYLYFWAPNGVNPNTLLVEASVHDYGVKMGNWSWPINNVSVSNIKFTRQGSAGVKTEGGCSYISVMGCEFTELYHGIDSYTADHNNYDHNTFRDTYASAVHCFDNNTTIDHNKLNNIALVGGEGESFFGYFGILVSGTGNTVRGNRLDNIGYSGIFSDGNTLVEKNFVSHFLYTLNDGGGVYWDNGVGVTVQDNIVVDPIGNMESIAMDHQTNVTVRVGIYFGNAIITNATVRRNTAANCDLGLWVDHTMVSHGHQIRDNVMFNNKDAQMGFSDYSNYNGPGAAYPFALPGYDDIYTNNTCYAMSNTQMCILAVNRWYNGVDFGTFANNKYHNPWNGNSFMIQKFVPSYDITYHGLASWLSIQGDETGSSNSPLSLTYPDGVDDHILVYNDSLSTQVKPLQGIWFDLDENQYVNSVTLDAFRSKVLVRAAGSFQGKVMLEGPLNGNVMSDDLRSAGLLPTADPYPQLGYTHTGGSTAASTLTAGPAQDAIVDWIVLEFRRANNSIAYSRSALVQRDGDIVDVDGTSNVQLPMSVNGSLSIVVRHRNHLAAMTASAITPVGGIYNFDFTTAATWGTNAQASVNGVMAMWAGDCNMDGVLKYIGTNNDRDLVLSAIGGMVPTAVINGYRSEDVNLDGVVKYVGSDNDRDVVLVNIGGVVPTNVRSAQLP